MPATPCARKETSRRGCLFATGWLLVAAILFPSVHAQDFPSRPIRVVLPYGPGGGTDQLARSFTDYLTKSLGQPVVVDNRPGANGLVAAENMLRAQADGYTLYFPSESQMAINPHLYRSLPYDAEKDFVPVSLLGKSDVLLVVPPTFNASSVQQFIAIAKASPGKLNYAFPGIGSPHQLTTERFKIATGTDIVGIPYQLTPAALLDIVEGRVQMMMVGTAPSIGLIQSGKLKALALGGERRHPLFPNVPTLSESGVDLVAFSWWGIVAKRGTPAERLKKLEQELIKAAKAPEVTERMAKVGLDVVGSTSEEFASLIRRDFDAYGAVIRRINLPKQ